MTKTPFRAVPDTNVLLAAEMRPGSASPNTEFFDRWKDEDFTVLYSEDTLLEYTKKLREKGLPEDTVDRFLVVLLKLGVEIYIQYYHLPAYPVDADDIAFLLCADNDDATHIVTYDRHLRDVGDHYAFDVCNSVEFLRELRQLLDEG